MPSPVAAIADNEASELDAEIVALEGVLMRLRAMRRAAREMPIVDEPMAVPENRPAQFRDDDLIGLHVAAKRFGIPDDKLRRWCRNHDVGRKRGGRWMISVSLLRKHMGR